MSGGSFKVGRGARERPCWGVKWGFLFEGGPIIYFKYQISDNSAVLYSIQCK
jgi:hypothetical protein